MRLVVLIIIVALLAFLWWPRHEPVPMEETPIGDEFKPLQKAQQFQLRDYNEALQKHREQLDKREAEDGG